MGENCGDHRPLVDRRVLRRLRTELGSDADYCDTFLDNYVRQLPSRIGRLRIALRAADSHAAFDAVLSLKTSSRMVGAVCLGSLAAELESWLRTIPEADYRIEMPRLCEQDQLLEQIDVCSHETLEQFSAQPAA